MNETMLTRRYACETCGRLCTTPLMRCGSCEKLTRFDGGADATLLWQAIEAEARMCQVKSDWETRIEYVQRVISVLKERMLQRRLQRFEEEINREAMACSTKKEIRG